MVVYGVAALPWGSYGRASGWRSGVDVLECPRRASRRNSMSGIILARQQAVSRECGKSSGSRPLELGPVAPQAVHENGELAGDGDAGALVALGLGQFQSPAFQRAVALEPGQKAVRRLVERMPERLVAGLGDGTGDVPFARLIAPRRQSGISSEIARSCKPRRVLDRRLEGQRRDRPDARHRHQPPTTGSPNSRSGMKTSWAKR